MAEPCIGSDFQTLDSEAVNPEKINGMKTVHIGMIGAGWAARNRHLPALKDISDASVDVIWSRDPANAAETASDFGISGTADTWEEIVDASNLDAVIIATPPVLHHAATLAALKAGKHVLCQARMARNLKEAIEMNQAARLSDRVTALYPPLPGLKGDGALCIIPTQNLQLVENPAEELPKKESVLGKWADLLLSAGVNVLLMHTRWLDDFETAAKFVSGNFDIFQRLEARIGAVVSDSLQRELGTPGRIILIGSSRHGFVVMHAMANNPDISAAIAHQPVVWFPNLQEFSGTDDNLIIMRNDLVQWVDRFPPRPLMIQTGYFDGRIGQHHYARLNSALADAYRRWGAEGRFKHDLMEIPGHSHDRVPESAIEGIIPWLSEQGLV